MKTSGDKESWRKVFRRKRKRVFPAWRKSASRGTVESLRGAPVFQGARTILLYYPVRKEISPLPLLDVSENKKLLFPRVDGEQLVLHQVSRPEAQLSRGKFGIKEPLPDKTEVIEPGRVDLALVPGVVFDRTGFRIGYGGGYYDRLLSKASDCWKVGLGYRFQVTDRLPRSSHDVAVDQVFTPGCVYDA